MIALLSDNNPGIHVAVVKREQHKLSEDLVWSPRRKKDWNHVPGKQVGASGGQVLWVGAKASGQMVAIECKIPKPPQGSLSQKKKVAGVGIAWLCS